MPKTAKTKLRRLPKRGHHDRATIDAILDEALVAHMGFVHDGQPLVIPTLHARLGDEVMIHGSSASRALRALSEGAPLCLTVTLIDGLVLARSAFHHSVNYRSVVLLGQARLLEDAGEKAAALEAFTERMVPGRWESIRWPNAKELKATKVLALPIDEASAKVRTGGPVDDDEDYAMDTWAGVVPLRTVAGAPVEDELLREDIDLPDHVTRLSASA
jgi:nitroimidazol reductase NimA-like FMN-containing flavoprotein (pyridoxamine 5'-phosphate oxidase superfamily)